MSGLANTNIYPPETIELSRRRDPENRFVDVVRYQTLFIGDLIVCPHPWRVELQGWSRVDWPRNRDPQFAFVEQCPICRAVWAAWTEYETAK